MLLRNFSSKQQQSEDQMRKQQLKFKRKAIFYLKEAFIHSNTLDTRSAQQVIPIRRYIGLGRSLLVFSPGALYKRDAAAAGHNTACHAAAIKRCTRAPSNDADRGR